MLTFDLNDQERVLDKVHFGIRKSTDKTILWSHTKIYLYQNVLQWHISEQIQCHRQFLLFSNYIIKGLLLIVLVCFPYKPIELSLIIGFLDVRTFSFLIQCYEKQVLYTLVNFVCIFIFHIFLSDNSPCLGCYIHSIPVIIYNSGSKGSMRETIWGCSRWWNRLC